MHKAICTYTNGGYPVYIMKHGSSFIVIKGGVDKKKKVLKDILEYDSEEDKWTKVGDLPHPRYHHAISLVPKETADSCVWTFYKEFRFLYKSQNWKNTILHYLLFVLFEAD